MNQWHGWKFDINLDNSEIKIYVFSRAVVKYRPPEVNTQRVGRSVGACALEVCLTARLTGWPFKKTVSKFLPTQPGQTIVSNAAWCHNLVPRLREEPRHSREVDGSGEFGCEVGVGGREVLFAANKLSYLEVKTNVLIVGINYVRIVNYANYRLRHLELTPGSF